DHGSEDSQSAIPYLASFRGHGCGAAADQRFGDLLRFKSGQNGGAAGLDSGLSVLLSKLNQFNETGPDSRPEALSILGRCDECFDHLGADEVAVELVQLVQPKFVAGVVCVLRIVRVAPQVTNELHQHKRAIELLLLQN